VVAATVTANRVQSLALRTLIGIVIVCDIMILLSTDAKAFATDALDVGGLAEALFFLLGSLFLWATVRIGQPVRRTLPWWSSGPAVATNLRST